MVGRDWERGAVECFRSVGFPAFGGGFTALAPPAGGTAMSEEPAACACVALDKRLVLGAAGAGGSVDDTWDGAAFEPSAADGADGDGGGGSFGRLGRVTLLVTAAVKCAVSNTTGAGTNGGGNQADATFEPSAEDGTIGSICGKMSGRLGRAMVVVSATTPGRSDCDDFFMNLPVVAADVRRRSPSKTEASASSRRRLRGSWF